MDDRAERWWKWVLRGLGVLGFFFLLYLKLVSHQDPSVSFYVLLSGLLGLPNVIAYQLRVNRRTREDDSQDDDDQDPDDDHEARHGYVP